MPHRQQQAKTEGTSRKPPAGTAAARWAGTIIATEAMKRTGMKRTSFYKLAAEDKEAGK